MIRHRTQPEIERAEILNIININMDAAGFYAAAQKKIGNMALNSTLKELEMIHLQSIKRLQNFLKKDQAKVKFPKPHKTLLGITFRLFSEIEARISNAPDKILVSKLNEVEDRCLHYLKNVINEKVINQSVQTCLGRELVELTRTHDYMKNLNNAFVA